MEKRRKIRNGNDFKHKSLNKLIKRKITVAEEMQLTERCEEMERLEEHHDSLNLQKII